MSATLTARRVLSTAHGVVHLLRIPLCSWCAEPLIDAHGQPSWDLFDVGLTFVCRGGCTPVPVASRRSRLM